MWTARGHKFPNEKMKQNILDFACFLLVPVIRHKTRKKLKFNKRKPYVRTEGKGGKEKLSIS